MDIVQEQTSSILAKLQEQLQESYPDVGTAQCPIQAADTVLVRTFNRWLVDNYNMQVAEQSQGQAPDEEAEE